MTPQIAEEVSVVKLATGMRYADGIAWSREGFVLVADTVRRQVVKIQKDQNAKNMEGFGGAQGLTYDSQGRLHLCRPGERRVVRIDKRGNPETLADAFEGKKLNSPNDVVVRRDGNVWFTDPAFAGALDTRELGFHGVFHVNTKGVVEAAAQWQTRPNGIALSNDGKTLFVSDADRHAVVAFDVDSKGVASGTRDVVQGIDGVPNGIRVDADGRIYVCARGLAIYSATGKLIRMLMETEIVTNCAFGDDDLRGLYVSTPTTVYKLGAGVKGSLQY